MHIINFNDNKIILKFGVGFSNQECFRVENAFANKYFVFWSKYDTTVFNLLN